jgi:hypothetical protein
VEGKEKREQPAETEAGRDGKDRPVKVIIQKSHLAQQSTIKSQGRRYLSFVHHQRTKIS